MTKRSKKISVGILVASMMITIHLFAYPFMVLFLSKVFYNHTFPYWQTFNFQLTEHFIKLIIIYFLPLPIMLVYENKLLKKQVIEKTELLKRDFINSLIVSDFNNKKIVIDTSEILYFSANSPYINIHHPVKRYLYSDTLKSLHTQLDNDQFIRIHKSCIVNITKVISYQSRLNGDYDLLLSDKTTLRVSRNYAATFKSAFEVQHRLTT
ncbi:MAG: LytTR family DNA-binding domain-containing protein [Ginsengibacter sp.]